MSSSEDNHNHAPALCSPLIRGMTIVGVVYAVFLAGLLAALILSDDPKETVGRTGQFGDSFGALNALFTGLAFVALIVTLILQRRELQSSLDLLKHSVDAQREMAASAKEELTQTSLSQRQTTYGALYAQQQAITHFFATHLDLWPYFYDNTDIPSSDPNYRLAMFMAEMLADFFEHLLLELPTLPPDIAEGWERYAKLKFSTSPPLRAYFKDRRDLYGEDVLRMLGAP